MGSVVIFTVFAVKSEGPSSRTCLQPPRVDVPAKMLTARAQCLEGPLSLELAPETWKVNVLQIWAARDIGAFGFDGKNRENNDGTHRHRLHSADHWLAEGLVLMGSVGRLRLFFFLCGGIVPPHISGANLPHISGANLPHISGANLPHILGDNPPQTPNEPPIGTHEYSMLCSRHVSLSLFDGCLFVFFLLRSHVLVLFLSFVVCVSPSRVVCVWA